MGCDRKLNKFALLRDLFAGIGGGSIDEDGRGPAEVMLLDAFVAFVVLKDPAAEPLATLWLGLGRAPDAKKTLVTVSIYLRTERIDALDTDVLPRFPLSLCCCSCLGLLDKDSSWSASFLFRGGRVEFSCWCMFPSLSSTISSSSPEESDVGASVDKVNEPELNLRVYAGDAEDR